MTGRRYRDPMAKRLARTFYRAGLALHARMSAPTSGGGAPRVYYGGARAGDRGGPLVKMAKLAESFPERRWGYNLVYVLSNAPYLSAATLDRLKKRDVAIVANQDGVFFPAWFAGDCAAENRPMADVHRLADHVFYQSEFCRRSAERFLGPRGGPSEILYNAVDCRRFAPVGEGHRAATFVFLVAGKIGSHQSYRVVVPIEALAVARRRGLDATLRIAGPIEAGARAEAGAAAARAGIEDRVAFLGPYAQAQAPAVFAGADAFVTVTHNDACPSTAIEAMASGLPVVHARSGGVPELVGDGAGIAIEVGESWDRPMVPEPEAVAAAMLDVAARRPALAMAARARAVERFDLPHWIERHRRVFESLVGAGRG